MHLAQHCHYLPLDTFPLSLWIRHTVLINATNLFVDMIQCSLNHKAFGKHTIMEYMIPQTVQLSLFVHRYMHVLHTSTTECSVAQRHKLRLSICTGQERFWLRNNLVFSVTTAKQLQMMD